MKSYFSKNFRKDSGASSDESLITSTETLSTVIDGSWSADTEVVVVGNGPAGLSLSTFLSGWQPFYNVNSPHPDPRIHEKLSQNAEQSLLDQDLSWFEAEFEELLNPGVRPVAQLLDMLMRPINHLQFQYNQTTDIPHLVFGETDIGGSWTEYDEEMITVSLANWLDLPGFTIEEWLKGQPLVARLPAGVVREYLKAYAEKMNLLSKMKSRTKITEITKLHDGFSKDVFYQVSGEDSEGQSFTVRCKKVVLACGQSHQRHLEVEGEYLEPNVVYDVTHLKRVLHMEEGLQRGKILIVGDGISAADAINFCLKNQLPVLHVMKRSELQLKQTMLSKLSPSIYPEYAKAYKLMTGKRENVLYERVTSASVIKLSKRVATIRVMDKEIHESFQVLVACIGRRSELSMFPEKIEFNADYRCDSDPQIFAVGSLAGDHFIRYLVGGCLQVASSLLKDRAMEFQQKKLQIVQSQMAQQLQEVERRQKRLRRKPATRCCRLGHILSTSS
ncbi:hypothetical protein FO519_003274 [Halicephalobus sp. NKZ332]|nr:hypothetical protein FO519_003274 [Halicephalobus sp. NKZ332]